MSFFVDYIWLVPLFSLIAFLIISTGNMFVLHRNSRISAYLTLSSSFLGLVFGVLAFIYCYISENIWFERTFSWISVDALSFDFGFMVDNLSATMVVMVCFISLLVQIFSMGYMKEDPEYSKFFGYLALFNFAMCFLVLSPNLFQAYIFWEMVGLCSYLLIGVWYWKNSASKAAYKAFIVNRVGDFGFLLGMVAFGFGTAGGVLIAKLMNKLDPKHPVNPLIGSAGVSAVPMAARVSSKEGQKEDSQNFLLMHAMGPNVSGVIGSAVAAGVLIAVVPTMMSAL